MTLRRAVSLLLACILPLAAGCSRHTPQPAPQPTGALQGSIAFPGYKPSSGISKASLPPACTAGKWDRHLLIEDVMVPRSQPSVFLWISAGLPAHTRKPPHSPVVLTRILCGFQPQLVGVLPGRPVDFTNSDPAFAHFHIAPRIPGNPSFNLTLPPGRPGKLRSFPHPELLIPVTMPDFPHAHAWINVVPNSYFTLSGPHGHFLIPHLPPGVYTLSAISPGYPAQAQSVTVRPNAVTPIRFTFPTPAPAPASRKK